MSSQFISNLPLTDIHLPNPNATMLTDIELLRQIQQRSKPALELLYDRYSARALGLAFKILKDRDLAEEVTQEAFWRVWQRAEQFQAGKGAFGNWFFGIVRNLAIDELRRREARPATEEDEELEAHLAQYQAAQEDIVEVVSNRLRSESIRQALQALPDAQREVLELSYFEGFTREEIARHLDQPLGTIHTRARLGLNRLRELFTSSPFEREVRA